MTKLVFSFFILILTSNTLVNAKDYPNPFIEQRADPWIYKHTDGYYYFIATVPAFDRIEMRRAKTLAALPCAEPVTVWRKNDTGKMSNHIWAPELHYINGKWYIYVAAGESGVWRVRMQVLENDSANPLEGEWEPKGQTITKWDTFSLDATTFEHKGTRYLVWAQHEPNIGGNTSLFIAEMDTPWSITGEQVLISTPEYDWEIQLFHVNEGPAVLKRNGRIFITYSASGTDHNYAMGLLYADENANLLDAESWEKSPTPVLSTNEADGVFGPGHNGFTTDEEGNDILVYHARNYKKLIGTPLTDPNRHARISRIEWDEDGFPIFKAPADSAPKVADKPLFRDPIYDGTADPVILWNPERARWWMFYTNRRAKADGLSGVAWVHGTHIGIAESCDDGATWNYFGETNINLPVEIESENPTHWAPEVMTGPDGTHHMYLTVVPGVFEDWRHPRNIVHLTSSDLLNWNYESTLTLASDRVIDACVARLPDGKWRMWYNNERDSKSIYYAESEDLYNWVDKGKAVGDQSGEGPKVFEWQNAYWMVTDVWDGLGVYKSENALDWERQEGPNLVQTPGTGADDGVKGGHPDVVVQGDQAYLFYFTHPGRTGESPEDGYETRRSSIQVVTLKHKDGKLFADRDEPTYIKLDPRFSTIAR